MYIKKGIIYMPDRFVAKQAKKEMLKNIGSA